MVRFFWQGVTRVVQPLFDRCSQPESSRVINRTHGIDDGRHHVAHHTRSDFSGIDSTSAEFARFRFLVCIQTSRTSRDKQSMSRSKRNPEQLAGEGIFGWT